MAGVERVPAGRPLRELGGAPGATYPHFRIDEERDGALVLSGWSPDRAPVQLRVPRLTELGASDELGAGSMIALEFCSDARVVERIFLHVRDVAADGLWLETDLGPLSETSKGVLQTLCVDLVRAAGLPAHGEPRPGVQQLLETLAVLVAGAP